MRLKLSLGLALIPLIFTFSPAKASIFTFDKDNAGGNSYVGEHANITTTYDSNTDLLTWSSTLTSSPNTDGYIDGAWVVLSGGDNPRGDVNEYAIFYMDALNNKVTIYDYDGTASARSYQTGTYLGSTALEVSDTAQDRTIQFSIDATDLNNRTDLGADWKGATFGEEIGIWFHGVETLNTVYRPDGSLDAFKFEAQGWYDQGNEDTVRVPEPGVIAALGFFSIAATKLRKRFS